MLNFVCVRMGTKYGIEYVDRLRNMILRHTPSILWSSDQARFSCITDQPEEAEGWSMIKTNLPYNDVSGWWGKMALFSPSLRWKGPTIYFDLDTVIIDTIAPLVDFAFAAKEFAICANFTRRAGKLNYPCAYGSCVMVLPEGFGYDVFNQFVKHSRDMIDQAGAFGDQWVIERMIPGATLLQDVMPPGFFVGRREFDVIRPEGASLLIFAGKTKPDNCNIQWIKEEWK